MCMCSLSLSKIFFFFLSSILNLKRMPLCCWLKKNVYLWLKSWKVDWKRFESWKADWRERDKRGELYLLKFLFDFFWVDPGQPGSIHLTRDPIIRPDRPPSQVSKLCLESYILSCLWKDEITRVDAWFLAVPVIFFEMQCSSTQLSLQCISIEDADFLSLSYSALFFTPIIAHFFIFWGSFPCTSRNFSCFMSREQFAAPYAGFYAPNLILAVWLLIFHFLFPNALLWSVSPSPSTMFISSVKEQMIGGWL